VQAGRVSPKKHHLQISDLAHPGGLKIKVPTISGNERRGHLSEHIVGSLNPLKGERAIDLQ
jgi:hypothetical protein